ncbi:hypothetical protein MHI22_01765 [Lysinibacillus sp. FSL L8-0312]|uniref:hypothetical protein n=1 Tax=Lysinibacillus sp. FSL L8-0312 TaxID=2921521 RepID=UPI0030F78A11
MKDKISKEVDSTFEEKDNLSKEVDKTWKERDNPSKEVDRTPEEKDNHQSMDRTKKRGIEPPKAKDSHSYNTYIFAILQLQKDSNYTFLKGI